MVSADDIRRKYGSDGGIDLGDTGTTIGKDGAQSRIPKSRIGVPSGRGGGGGSGSSGGVSIDPNVALAQQQEIAKQQEIARQQEQARQNQALRERQIIVKGGAVSIGKKKFVGQAIVTGTGLTANEYGRRLRAEQVSKGKLSARDVGRVTYTITPAVEKTQLTKTSKTFTTDVPGGIYTTVNASNLPSFTKTLQASYDHGLISTPYIPPEYRRVYTEPTIIKRPTGFFKDPETGKNIPTTELIVINPPTTDSPFSSERRTVKEEAELYDEATRGYQIGEGSGKFADTISKYSGYDKQKEGYGKLNTVLYQQYTKPVGDLIVESTKGTSFGGETGLTIAKAKQNIRESHEFIITSSQKLGRKTDAFLFGTNSIPNPKFTYNVNAKRETGIVITTPVKEREPTIVSNAITTYGELLATGGSIFASAGVGIAEDVTYKPLKQVALVSLGVGIGAVTSGVGIGANAIGRAGLKSIPSAVDASRASAIGRAVLTSIPSTVDASINVAGYGVGGLYVLNRGTKLLESESIYELGETAGVTFKDVTLVGVGSVFGTKATVKIRDVFRARGRVELPVEEFGLKPISEVLSGKTRFVERSQFGGKSRGWSVLQNQKFDLKIFERAGRSYHVTPNKYWKEQFEAIKGKSKFAGLYTAPSPSVYFGKAGESKISAFGLFKAPTEPAVAVITCSKFTTKGLKVGEGYITGVKPEIESVFKVRTTFQKTGSDTFFKFGGRVFIADTFDIVSIVYATKISTPTLSGSSSGSSASIFSSLPVYSPTSGFTPTGSSGSGSPSIYKSVVISTPSISSSKVYSSSSRIGSSGSGSSVSSYSPSSVSSYKPSKSSALSSLGSSYKSGGSSLYKSFLSSSRGGSSGSSSFFRPFQSQEKGLFYKPYRPKFKTSTKGYTVSVRRRGKFKPIATGVSLKSAFNIGRGRVAKTLGATFRIKGTRLRGTPRGFYSKQSKQGTLFIEQPKFRLSTKTEKKEIKRAKRRKGLF